MTGGFVSKVQVKAGSSFVFKPNTETGFSAECEELTLQSRLCAAKRFVMHEV